jgi:hypothetical protein
MQLRYDEDFIEAAVFRCATRRQKAMRPLVAGEANGCRVHPLQLARFHRERERLYGVLDPDERNAAFFKLHLDWFREWGLEKPLAEALKEYPLLAQKLTVLAVRKPHGKNDEGAELYVNHAGQRSAVVALRPELFEREPELRTYMRHEFTHLNDMLDPAFGYEPALDLPGLNGAQQRLARERYRLLWDITIDGRLAAAGHAPMATRDQHAAAFARGYAFWPEQRRSDVFALLWQKAAPRHADFLALIADPRGLREAHRPAPGASCPLCGFSTFQWGGAEQLGGEVGKAILREFPRWTPEQGACERCVEIFLSSRSQNRVR